MNRRIKILAVSGGLRPTSTNALLVKEIQKWAPANVAISIYEGLATLPAFDDSTTISESVTEWRRQLSDADGVLICSPEYAFGVPGALKNAIEWTVKSSELVNKPLALITAASSGDKAHAAWLQIFSALSADIPAGGALLIPFIRTKFNEKGEVSDAATKEAILNTLQALIQTIDKKASEEMEQT
ncbi:NADPH-dependent FMN reductase [Niastella yeongjuensis]|nr:NADPH-dependent FMN reductase [Niastella yeongjuensis]SEN38275.1 NAD(P)H-dependent FMN reductase [Niastella yeongjuensis]